MNPEPYDQESLQLIREVAQLLASDEDPARAVGNLFARRAEFLTPLRFEHSRLQANTLDRFADAFDALELALLLCQPLEKITGRWAYDDESEEGAGPWALTDLFRSGLIAAGEVLALMRAGYTTGALARWRALHEIATKAEFVSGGGIFLLETARRYLQHEEYRSVREMEIWQGWMRKVDPSHALPRNVWRRWKADADEEIQRYGPTFLGEYGWAHEQLIATSPEYVDFVEADARLRGPVFEDLERAVRGRSDDPMRWRLLYAIANAAVHGAPRASIGFDLESGTRVRRSGPHLGPLWEPGEATAHRLADLTWAFGLPDYGVEDGDPHVGIIDKRGCPGARRTLR